MFSAVNTMHVVGSSKSMFSAANAVHVVCNSKSMFSEANTEQVAGTHFCSGNPGIDHSVAVNAIHTVRHTSATLRTIEDSGSCSKSNEFGNISQ